MNAGEKAGSCGAMGRLVSRLSELKIHLELVPQLIISQLNVWYCEGTFVHLFPKEKQLQPQPQGGAGLRRRWRMFNNI